MLLRHRPFEREPSVKSHKQVHRAYLRKHFEEYRQFVVAVGDQIGELSPLVGEDCRDIRVFVQMAARELGYNARTWVDDGKVYFFLRRESP